MDLFITVAALAVAIYAVAPRERQLDFGLRFGRHEVLLVLFGFLFTLYLELYDFFEHHHLAVARSRWPFGLNPENAKYLVMVALITCLFDRARTARLSPKRIFRFQQLADDLLWGGHLGELMSIMDRHAEEVFKIARADFLLARLRLWFSPPLSFEYFLADHSKARKEREGWLWSIWPGVGARIGRILPNYKREASVAHDIIRSVLLSRPFVQALATSRPYLALRLLSGWPRSFDKIKFVHGYLRVLIENDSSVLYTELEHNQNMLSGNRYQIPESNRILYFFLADPRVAFELSIWKPLGDFVEFHLDHLGRCPEEDPYNRSIAGFERGEEKWQSPEYALVRFFDIMVMEALYQGVEWHMWLYYLPHIVERMVRNYRVNDPLSDAESEFPNQYALLLYEIFDVLRTWILELEHIPEAQANVVLRWARAESENGNIPKSSILALGQCLRLVVNGVYVGNRQKKAFVSKSLEIYFDLRALGKDRYAEALIESLLGGGICYRRDDVAYLKMLVQFFEEEEGEYRITHPDEWVDSLRDKLSRIV